MGMSSSQQRVLDAIVDARTLVVCARPRFGSQLWRAQDSGGRAVVASLNGRENLAALYACEAAHAAFRAVRRLR